LTVWSGCGDLAAARVGRNCVDLEQGPVVLWLDVQVHALQTLPKKLLSFDIGNTW
jgi:hypothetical protein